MGRILPILYFLFYKDRAIDEFLKLSMKEVKKGNTIDVYAYVKVKNEL